MNYKPFSSCDYKSPPLPNMVLKESVDGAYALVPFTKDFLGSAKASDYSITSQLKSGVSLVEVNKIQPINRVSAAESANQLMSNIQKTLNNG